MRHRFAPQEGLIIVPTRVLALRETLLSVLLSIPGRPVLLSIPNCWWF